MAQSGSDLGRHMATVAAALLGAPNERLSAKGKPRYGTNGSLEVNLEKATFYDFEEESGGGLLDLIKRVKGFEGRAAFDWMREIGCDIEAPGEPRKANGHANGNGVDHHPNAPDADQEPAREPEPPRGKREVEATYDYVDEAGTLLFQTQRIVFRLPDGSYETDAKTGKRRKTFTQRRPEGRDQFVYNLNGVRIVPYRLPEVIEALSEGRDVFVCEGEKKADLLWSMTVPATCNPMGAGKWPESFNDIFQGARLVGLPDNDEAGRKHVATIAAALKGIADFRVLDLPGLPPKGDVVEWHAAGGTADQLYELAEHAKPWAPAPAAPQRFRLRPFGQVAVAAGPRYLVRGLIPLTGIIVVWGPPKCGKSFAVHDMLMHVALSWPYRGRKVVAGAVVTLVLEGESGYSTRAAAFRLRRLAGHVGEVPFYDIVTRLDLVADHAVLIADIRLQLGEVRPVAVVIDTLNRSLRGSESSDQDMGAYVKAADVIREAFDCAVIIIHHCGIEATRPRGHSSLTGAADAQLSVRRDPANNVVMAVEFMKDGPTGDKIVSRLDKVEVGHEPDGYPITSCVVSALSDDDAAAAAKGEYGFKVRDTQSVPEETLFRALMQAVDERGVVPPSELELPRSIAKVVEYKHVREIFRSKMLQVDEDPRQHEANLKKQMQRAGTSLKKFALIGAKHPWVWWTGKPVRSDRGLIAGPPAALTIPQGDLPADAADLLDGV